MIYCRYRDYMKLYSRFCNLVRSLYHAILNYSSAAIIIFISMHHVLSVFRHSQFVI